MLICGLLCPIWWRQGDADRRAADADLGAFGIGWRASDSVFVVFPVNVTEHAYRKSINVASIA
jgi:hypothetical protein